MFPSPSRIDWSIVISLLVLLMSLIIATARAGGAFHAATCRTVPPSRGCGMESCAATSPAGWDRRSVTSPWSSSHDDVARARWRGDRDARSSGSLARDDVRSGPDACGRDAVRDGWAEAEDGGRSDDDDLDADARAGERCELMADAMESTPPPPGREPRRFFPRDADATLPDDLPAPLGGGGGLWSDAASCSASLSLHPPDEIAVWSTLSLLSSARLFQ